MNETLDLKQLETLARLYLDGRLTRLEEKELEYVLMRSDVSSPLLDEVREEMAVLTMLGAGVAGRRKPGAGRKRFARVWRVWVGVAAAACAAIVFTVGATRGAKSADTDDAMVYVCVDGRELSSAEAARVAAEAEARDLAMVAQLMAEARRESELVTQTLVDAERMRSLDEAMISMQ